MTQLWVNDDFVHGFEAYISQLNGLIQNIFQLDDTTMKTLPDVKRELMKLFYILKGIVHGLNT